MSSNHTHNKKNQTLTKNQRIVLNLLQDSGEPLKAYFILDSLKKEGLNSPLQVYRALDKLVELGKIHKVESLNSFIICNNSNCASNTAFTICERCGKVKEIKNNNLTEGVNELVRENKLYISRYNLEFYVVCNTCKIN